MGQTQSRKGIFLREVKNKFPQVEDERIIRRELRVSA